jgi:flagellar protein FliS
MVRFRHLGRVWPFHHDVRRLNSRTRGPRRQDTRTVEGLPPGFTALNRQRVAQGVQGYQRAAAETASPAQLIVMLYQGCIRFTAIGKTALEQQDYTTSRENLLKAQAIIAELMGSLNMSFGDLANNLMRLYDYMYRRLIDANIRRDAAAADEVEGLLRGLLPAWEQAVKTYHAELAAGTAPPIGSVPTNLAG